MLSSNRSSILCFCINIVIIRIKKITICQQFNREIIDTFAEYKNKDGKFIHRNQQFLYGHFFIH